MQSKKLKVTRTAHYYCLGNDKNPKNIWFVLHGYGYLASKFIKYFEALDSNNNLIIAPEGLSYFYINGVNGKVGASWMTKEHREDEIEDYMNYLNNLYNLILKSYPNTSVNILGFSQGGATASRWLMNNKIKCNHFILWASVFPDDITIEFPRCSTIFIIKGTKDEYVSEERFETLEKILISKKLNYKKIVFEGKHIIEKETLLKLEKMI